MEIMALITQAKSLGLEPGQLFNLLLVSFIVSRAMKKKIDELIKTFKTDKEETNKRIERIEGHVGLPKLKES